MDRTQLTPQHESDFAPQSAIRNPQSAIRVMWIWHAAVVAEYQKPLTVLAGCHDLDVTLLVPRRWPERSGCST